MGARISRPMFYAILTNTKTNKRMARYVQQVSTTAQGAVLLEFETGFQAIRPEDNTVVEIRLTKPPGFDTLVKSGVTDAAERQPTAHAPPLTLHAGACLAYNSGITNIMALSIKITGWTDELNFFTNLGIAPDDAYHEVHEYYWYVTEADIPHLQQLYSEWRQQRGYDSKPLAHSAIHLHQVVKPEAEP